MDNLLIFGASVRAAAFSALRAGLRPWCADLFADADLRGRCPAMRLPGRYPLDFLNLIGTEVPGPWMYTGGLENYPFLISQLADRRPLWGCGASALLAVRNPYALGEVCRRLGLPAPRVEMGLRPKSSGRWLVKPIAGAGGAGVRFWSADGPPPERDTYLQEYIEGSPAAAVYVAAKGGARLLGLTRQLIGEGWLNAAGFRYCGSVGPVAPSAVLRPRLERLGAALAARAGLVGLFGVDGVISGDAFWPVEVNPRYTASVEVLEHGAGVPALRLHRRACEEGELPEAAPAGGTGGAVGKAVLFARRDAVFPDDGPWRGEGGRPVEELPDYADIPDAGAGLEAGHPVLTVFARAADEAGCVAELRRRAAEVGRWLEGTNDAQRAG